MQMGTCGASCGTHRSDDDSLVDHPNTIINSQVTNGVAVRMSIFYLLAGGSPLEEMNEE